MIHPPEPSHAVTDPPEPRRPRTRPYDWAPYTPEETVARLRDARTIARARRSVRHFADTPVPREAIAHAIAVAGTAPSGANRQPWFFVAISDLATKRRIRDAAEAEERTFYRSRAPRSWLDALSHLGTDEVKPHLTEAPWLVVVFRRDHEVAPDGTRLKNYYVNESVGIAVGFLVQALHRAGLSTLTHTPSPMGFLREICGRPAHERPYVLMPVGYPAPGCRVPDIDRKPLEEIAELR